MAKHDLRRHEPNGLEIGEVPRRRGSGRVDVLGVVAFGVVMAACLFPAVGALRVSSKESSCLHNLARIGFANSVYAGENISDPALPVHRLQFQQCGTDHEGLCPSPSFIGAYEWGGKSGVGRPDWLDVGGDFGSKYGTAAGFGPATRPLNRILYKKPFVDYTEPWDWLGAALDTQLDLPEFHCPADIGYTGIHFPAFRDEGQSSYDHFGTSYTANMFMIADQAGGVMRSNSPYLHKLSEIRNPARTLAYYENNGRFAWSAAPMPSVCYWIGPGIEGTVRGWHGKDWTFNAAFIDGHVGPIYMRTFANEIVFPNEILQQTYGCIIVRGEGWQKDTLPLEPVPTSLGWGGLLGRPSWEDGIE